MFKFLVTLCLVGFAVAKPSFGTVGYTAPVAYSTHAVSYSAPAVSYSAPAVTYSAPALSYSAPVTYSAAYTAPAAVASVAHHVAPVPRVAHVAPVYSTYAAAPVYSTYAAAAPVAYNSYAYGSYPYLWKRK